MSNSRCLQCSIQCSYLTGLLIPLRALVRIFFQITEEIFMKEHYGCRPETYPDILALAGDRSDGIPGVKVGMLVVELKFMQWRRYNHNRSAVYLHRHA